MALAARLAHLVRRTISGVGRRARHASEERGWLTPRVLVAVFFLLMLSVGFVIGLGGSAAPLGHHRAARHGPRAAVRHERPGAQADAGNAVLEQLGASGAAVLPAATGAPTPATTAEADQPPLATRENFAFAPVLDAGPGADLRPHRAVDHRLLRRRREPRRQSRRERGRLVGLREPGPGRPHFAGACGGRAGGAHGQRLRPELPECADVVAHRGRHAVGRPHPAAWGQVARWGELRLRGRRPRGPERD